MTILTLYHGSPDIIEKPAYGKGSPYNDYGLGFYCTEHLELAKEWACTLDTDGYANQYTLDLAGLKVLNLSDRQYNVLHWLALLVDNRRFYNLSPMARRGIEWLQAEYLLDISAYDIIIGYRADDSYFSFARAFISNTISVGQLAYAMRLGKLGEQIVLKSPKAFEQIRYVGCEQASNTEFYAKRMARDEQARTAYRAELERDNLDGLFIRDLMRTGVKADDPRLR